MGHFDYNFIALSVIVTTVPFGTVSSGMTGIHGYYLPSALRLTLHMTLREGYCFIIYIAYCLFALLFFNNKDLSI